MKSTINQMSASFSPSSTIVDNATNPLVSSMTSHTTQPYLKSPMDLLEDGGVGFLGSKIRIFSKAKIRYEGIFYTFNNSDKTISLSSVKSFGTETRLVGRYVAPRDDEVYSYIVFKIGDITDIQILENMENLEGMEEDQMDETHNYRYRVPTCP